MYIVRYVCHVSSKTEKIRQLLEKKLRDIKFYKHLFNGPTITCVHTDERTDGQWGSDRNYARMRKAPKKYNSYTFILLA